MQHSLICIIIYNTTADGFLYTILITEIYTIMNKTNVTISHDHAAP